MAAAATIHELRDLCKQVQPAILFLMETRAPLERVERMRITLKFKYVYCVEARGMSGGICLFWNDSFKVEILDSNQNFIHATIEDKSKNKVWLGTFIYANPIYTQRRNLWPQITNLNTDTNIP